MATTPRERARVQTLADITRIGREHLKSEGAASLSLRAVARDLGVVSSAVYRYVKNRDELLTLLVVDAYTELGDLVDAAVDSTDEFRAQFYAVGTAVRTWATREPARYALVFGSPVPGYNAPADQTTEPGTRVIYALVKIIDAAWRSGKITSKDSASLTDSLATDFENLRAELGTTMSDDILARGVLVWAALFGAVSFDVFDQYGAQTFSNRDQLFEYQLRVLGDVIGLV